MSDIWHNVKEAEMAYVIAPQKMFQKSSSEGGSHFILKPLFWLKKPWLCFAHQLEKVCSHSNIAIFVMSAPLAFAIFLVYLSLPGLVGYKEVWQPVYELSHRLRGIPWGTMGGLEGSRCNGFQSSRRSCTLFPKHDRRGGATASAKRQRLRI